MRGDDTNWGMVLQNLNNAVSELQVDVATLQERVLVNHTQEIKEAKGEMKSVNMKLTIMMIFMFIDSSTNILNFWPKIAAILGK